LQPVTGKVSIYQGRLHWSATVSAISFMGRLIFNSY